jgi:hypothetical protein
MLAEVIATCKKVKGFKKCKDMLPIEEECDIT